MKTFWVTLLVTAIGLAGTPAVAFPDRGTVFLVDREGQETPIGSIAFSGSGDTRGFAVTLETPLFTDHFLSMRPFRCIEGQTEWFCHLPYPYDLKMTVSAGDLQDLEYSLLFIKKAPSEFGIDAWNGLYYRLALQPDGSIAGELFEGDLNALASPPDTDRPIDLDEFIKAEADKRLYPGLIIR